MWISQCLGILSVEDVGIEASAGLPAAKLLCGDVGVAGEGGGGAVVAEKIWGPSSYEEGPQFCKFHLYFDLALSYLSQSTIPF